MKVSLVNATGSDFQTGVIQFNIGTTTWRISIASNTAYWISEKDNGVVTVYTLEAYKRYYMAFNEGPFSEVHLRIVNEHEMMKRIKDILRDVANSIICAEVTGEDE